MRQFKPKKVNKKLCLVHSVNSDFKQKWTLIVTALYSLVLASQVALRKTVKSKWNEACLLHCTGCGFWRLKETTLSISLDPPRFWAVGGVRGGAVPGFRLGAASFGRGRQANLTPLGLLQESCTASRARRRQPASSPRLGTSPSAPQGNWTRCASAAATPLFATGPGPRKGAVPPRPFGHGFPAPSCSSRQPFSQHTAEDRRRQPLLHCSSGLPSPAPRDSSGCPFILGREGNLFF